MDQLTDDTANSFNYTELGLNTAGGAGSGKLANMLGAKVELPDSITGSGSITAVGEWALSYLGNKPDMNISLSTAGKLTLTLVANQAADNIIGGSIDGLNDVGTSLLGLSPGTSTGSSSTPSDGTIPVGGIINQNTPTMFQLPVGGVLLNTAATLVGQNLSDITGAMYDPVSGQFVMLGTNNPAPIEGINLDYLYTALQAVYGSAQPPFVTLNPSASAYTQWSGQFAPGQSGGFTILYNPIWPNEDTTVDVLIFASQNGTPVQWRARYNCVPDPLAVYYYPWEIFPPMEMVFSNWVTDTYATPPPSGITFPTYEHVTYAGLATYQPFTLINGTANTYTISSVMVVPARQQRLFGGRVENTQVGWVMEEADRVMKGLSVGVDNITEAAYNSGTTTPALNTIPGYQNMAQRLAAGGGQNVNVRFWFTPNQMTLQQYIDPNTGLASVVFTNSTVSLNTESFMLGLPQSPQAKAFADNITTNYDKFAALKFPCYDPNDPTGHNIIYTNIFGMLRDVMKAVSLARFFRDNNIPVDMWWLNSWQPPVAYIPKSVPTAANITGNGGLEIYGGVQVNLPNTYIPSVTASNVAATVQSSRPAVAGNPNGDIQQQLWTNSTSVGSLKAVSVNSAAEPQNGNLNLSEVDLSFASPGGMPLQFVRYYQSSWLGNDLLGRGWRWTPVELEFGRPSWYDQNSLMQDSTGKVLYKFSNGDTGLRSGPIRVVDLSSGTTLDFNSSLVLGYAVDNTGNPVITVSGLTNDVPLFTPGLRQNGSALVQNPSDLTYQFTTPDGYSFTFDHDGNLLQAQGRYGRRQTYNYDDAEHLLNIKDDAYQLLSFSYDATSNFITSVTGPQNEQVIYSYTNGVLVGATHVRSGAYVSYQYNTNNQLVAKTLFNGQTMVQSQPDLKGRAITQTDMRGNSLVSTFTQDSAGSVRTNEITDPLVADLRFVPQQLEYDRSGRLLSSRDTTGAQTSYGYNAGSLLPNTIALPIAGRPPIAIQRNAYGEPNLISDPGNIGAQDVTATYDPNTSQLQQMTDEAGHPTTFLYNGNHSLSHVQQTHNGQIVDVGYGYDSSGQLSQITNPLGITAVTMNHDSLGRVTNVVDATGVTVSYQYDNLGRLWKLADPRLATPVTYVYDNFDRVTEIDFPTGTNYFAYDPIKGWLISQTDMLGRVIRFDRDQNTGDILQTVQIVPGGTNLVTVMSYDRFGNLASITPPQSATITYNYDAIGRQIGSTYSGVSIPGAPVGLVCNHATNGLPTWITNLVFSWQPPASSAGINGYSYALDQMPDDITNTVGTNVAINNVTLGTHLFQVKAQDTNGMWGPTADFTLIVTWVPGTEPPGAPPNLTCNVTADGVPVYTTNSSITYVVFNWQEPTSENGIAGYSYALTGMPTNVVNTTAATVTFASVAVGTYTFQVKAQGSNGVWGAVSIFHLNIVQLQTGNSSDVPLPEWSIWVLMLGVLTVGAWFIRRQNSGRLNEHKRVSE